MVIVMPKRVLYASSSILLSLTQGAGYLWGFLYCVVNHFPIILWQGMLPEPSGAKSRIKQSILVAFYHFGLFFSLKISRITPRRKVITINVIIFH